MIISYIFHSSAKNRHFPPPPRNRRRKKHTFPGPPNQVPVTTQIPESQNKEQRPYEFEDPNFFLPLEDRSSEVVTKHPKRRPPTTQIHKFVPTFVKEALAKSFLKKPEKYLERLYSRQRSRSKGPQTGLHHIR